MTPDEALDLLMKRAHYNENDLPVVVLRNYICEKRKKYGRPQGTIDRSVLREMYEQFRKDFPEVSIRQLCGLNNYGKVYINNHLQINGKCTQETVDNFKALFEEGRKHSERYERKEFTRKGK